MAAKYAISMRANPNRDEFFTFEQWAESIAMLRATAEGGKILDPITGEDISGLVEKPEPASRIWARFHGKLKASAGTAA